MVVMGVVSAAVWIMTGLWLWNFIACGMAILSTVTLDISISVDWSVVFCGELFIYLFNNTACHCQDCYRRTTCTTEAPTINLRNSLILLTLIDILKLVNQFCVFGIK